MIENAGRVARYLAGMDRQAFEQNEWARDAVERCKTAQARLPELAAEAKRALAQLRADQNDADGTM